MRYWPFLLLTLLLFTVPARAQDAAATLLIRVHDLEDQPVSAIIFTVQVDGMDAQTVQTDAGGAARVPNLVASSIRVLSAQRADGTLLLLDENDREGGLRIPLQAALIQPLDLRLDDTRLFVEPVALTRALSDTDLASVEATATASASPTTIPMESPAVVDTAGADPLGNVLGWVIALIPVVPVAIMGLLWVRRVITRRKQPLRRTP